MDDKSVCVILLRQKYYIIHKTDCKMNNANSKNQPTFIFGVLNMKIRKTNER